MKLRRSNFKMAQRVATVSKAIKDISGMGSRVESTGALRDTDLDARHIFVGVHAGGSPTHEALHVQFLGLSTPRWALTCSKQTVHMHDRAPCTLDMPLGATEHPAMDLSCLGAGTARVT